MVIVPWFHCLITCFSGLQYFAETEALDIQGIRAEILAVFPLNTAHEGFHGVEQVYCVQFFEKDEGWYFAYSPEKTVQSFIEIT